MSGRKPAYESRATEFRHRLTAWKRIPESSRPSLRALAREMDTSHQLLAHYLNDVNFKVHESAYEPELAEPMRGTYLRLSLQNEAFQESIMIQGTYLKTNCKVSSGTETIVPK